MYSFCFVLSLAILQLNDIVYGRQCFTCLLYLILPKFYPAQLSHICISFALNKIPAQILQATHSITYPFMVLLFCCCCCCCCCCFVVVVVVAFICDQDLTLYGRNDKFKLQKLIIIIYKYSKTALLLLQFSNLISVDNYERNSLIRGHHSYLSDPFLIKLSRR